LVLLAYRFIGGLGLLLILTQFLMACKTIEEKNEIAFTNNSGDVGTAALVENDSELSEKTITPDLKSEMKIVTNWLKEAEKAWFEKKDRELTRYCLEQITKAEIVDDSEITLYELLCRKVYTRKLIWDNSQLDSRNISRLFLDNDDLWMGTWSGGIGRYSIPLDGLTLFREAKDSLLVETIYSFLRQDNVIHMAGYGPIYGYDRRTSLFTTTYPKGPERINGLELYGGEIFASTVNNGIWVDQGRGNWQKFTVLGNSSLINTLLKDSKNQLLIGTADRGVLVYDGIRLINLNSLYPEFQGTNVTTLSEKGDLLMVGTYGEGGYIINRRTGKINFVSKGNENLSSDYVLCTFIGDNYAYWGTLGGGITAYSLKDHGQSYFLGMEEGLLSLDVASLVLYDKQIIAANLGQGLIIIEEEIIEKKL
jgi:hypothetical protein